MFRSMLRAVSTHRTFNGNVIRGLAASLAVAAATWVQPAAAQTHVVLGYQSSAGPAAINFGGQLTMTFLGLDGNIYLGQSNDGLNWRGAYQLNAGNGPERSFDSPGIANLNGTLYVAWTGTVGSGSNINIASSTDGVHFSRHLVGNLTSARGIALTANGGKLYLAFISTNPGQLGAASVISSSDGVNWSPPTSFPPIGVESPWTPTLLPYYNGEVMLAYTQQSAPSQPSRVIQVFQVAPGPYILVPPRPSTGVNAGSGIAGVGNLLWYAWVGPGVSSELWLRTYQLQSNNSLQVISENPTGQTAASNPAIQEFNGHAFMFWAGTDGGHHLNVEQLF